MVSSWGVISTYNDAGLRDSSVMARLIVSCLVLAALAGCGGGSAAKTGTPPERHLTDAIAAELDASLEKTVSGTGVPGASAAVVYPDGSMWTGAAGNAVLEPARAMTSETALPFDSITKTAVAALTMRLVEHGDLALDDPITKWYPAWRGDPEATVRDLLGHTSGQHDPPPAFFERLDPSGRIVTPRQALAASGKPGPRTTDAMYSNAGFELMGLILERVTGEPLSRAMRREVLGDADRLAMQPGERTDRPRANSYWYPKDLRRPEPVNDGSALIPSRQFATLAWTAGALAGDVPSLARWGHALFNDEIVLPSSLREMSTFRPTEYWDGYGLGLAQYSFDDREMWGHTGDGPGSHTEFWHLVKENVTIAVTWNDDVIEGNSGIFQGLVRAAF
jgi:D-alanyl-D-alanine carboxypeptidase